MVDIAQTILILLMMFLAFIFAMYKLTIKEGLCDSCKSQKKCSEKQEKYCEQLGHKTKGIEECTLYISNK